MARRGGGRIITLSSPISSRHTPDFGCMGALKAAVESLTRTMAVEFQKYNVTVNCISAGAVYGELMTKIPNSAKAIELWEEKTLPRRLMLPEEVANVANFLLSGAADAISGAVLLMDGGITIRI
eukprot:TRINITY_DN5504_c0_g1_i10.p2 TRINITY_DN5504_c0_g1~~TRINITY_DN5504_c0_g1_i10.p2  ORF type:complete len:124 (-),score=21.84 TRINITY_DN5504_c0_g1_i10:1119-1490(-)